MFRFGAFLITVAVALGGALLAGRSSDDFSVAMLISAGWFAALGVGALLVVRARRDLLGAVGGGVAVVVVVMGLVVGLPTLVGRTVDEAVAVGPTTAAGEFVPIAHQGSGRAAIVELRNGSRKLTLTGFETDSGPDLRVYLAARDPAEGALGDFVDLGGLKGNRGDQQYAVPPDVDLDRLRVVVVWCRAFSVPFTSAVLVRAGGPPVRAARTP